MPSAASNIPTKAKAKAKARTRVKAMPAAVPKPVPAKPVAQPPATVAKVTPVAAAARAAKATQPAAKAAKPANMAAAAKTLKVDKPKKPKLVRDSFTIPKAEYAVLEELKQRAARAGGAAKKSELLRAGIKALAGMDDAAFQAAMKAVPAIKTGRPAKV